MQSCPKIFDSAILPSSFRVRRAFRKHFWYPNIKFNSLTEACPFLNLMKSKTASISFGIEATAKNGARTAHRSTGALTLISICCLVASTPISMTDGWLKAVGILKMLMAILFMLEGAGRVSNGFTIVTDAWSPIYRILMVAWLRQYTSFYLSIKTREKRKREWFGFLIQTMLDYPAQVFWKTFRTHWNAIQISRSSNFLICTSLTEGLPCVVVE